MDVVIPVEVDINSIQVEHFNPTENKIGIRANLDLLEETREENILKAATKQRQVVNITTRESR